MHPVLGLYGVTLALLQMAWVSDKKKKIHLLTFEQCMLASVNEVVNKYFPSCKH